MNKIKKIPRRKRGESFVELLIAVLIVAFGCLMIATMYSASMSINISANEQDADFYKALEEIEKTGTSEKDVTVTIDEGDSESESDITVKVKEYGEGQISAYKKD